MTTGLSSKEARHRLKKFGMNVIFDDTRNGPSRVFHKLLYDPVSILLLVCALIIFTYKTMFEALLIVFIWLCHNVVTLLIYYKSEQIFSTVKSYGIPKCKVLRDGKKYIIDSRLLVPGDIVLVEAADIVCADLTILSSSDLYVYEYDVTGREELVYKSVSDDTDVILLSDMHGMLFASSSVVCGSAVCEVTATSSNTEIVSSAGLISMAGRHQPEMFYDIRKRCRVLGVVSITIALILFLLKILISPTDLFESFLIVASLIASSMSETLLPLSQIVTARYVYEAASKKDGAAVIKNAGSIDVLGKLDVIVITDDLDDFCDIDIKKELQLSTTQILICSDKKKAFSLASRYGLAVYRDLNECLSSTERISIFSLDDYAQRTYLIQRLKTQNKRVGVLTNRLDCIRMLDVSDVAFTNAHIDFKTNDRSKTIVDASNAKQNQILSRISDVLCSKTARALSSAIECAVSVFDTISESAAYLMTTLILRCILSFFGMFSVFATIRYNDILISGMIIDLFVVLTLSYVKRSNTHQTKPKVVLTAIRSSLLLIISFISVFLIYYFASNIHIDKLVFADSCIIAILTYSAYIIIRVCMLNRIKYNMHIVLVTSVLLPAFILAYTFFISELKIISIILAVCVVLIFALYSAIYDYFSHHKRASGDKK